jgi:hypothetical protein
MTDERGYSGVIDLAQDANRNLPDDGFHEFTRVSIVLAAMAKRLLLGKMKAGERLYYLKKLNDRVFDRQFTPEMLQAIEPMCPTQMAMFDELWKLDPPDDFYEIEPGRSVRAHRYSIGMLVRKDVFSHFAGLNPGIRAAAAIYKNGWSQPAAEGE